MMFSRNTTTLYNIYRGRQETVCNFCKFYHQQNSILVDSKSKYHIAEIMHNYSLLAGMLQVLVIEHLLYYIIQTIITYCMYSLADLPGEQYHTVPGQACHSGSSISRLLSPICGGSHDGRGTTRPCGASHCSTAIGNHYCFWQVA